MSWRAKRKVWTVLQARDALGVTSVMANWVMDVVLAEALVSWLGRLCIWAETVAESFLSTLLYC